MNIHFQSSLNSVEDYTAFHRGLFDAYARFGVEAAVSTPAASSSIYLALAKDEAGHICGGFRLHTPNSEPMLLHTLAYAPPSVREPSMAKLKGDEGELRGLWVEESERGTQLSAALVHTLVAMAPSLGVKTLALISHRALRRFYTACGFVVDADVEGFPYPDERYRSELYWCDAIGLGDLEQETRKRLLEMRSAIGQGESLSFPRAQRRVATRRESSLSY